MSPNNSVIPGTTQIWVARADAIEKRDDPTTWSNAETQVMRQLANRNEVAHSLTQIARNPSAATGLEGLISGRLYSISNLRSMRMANSLALCARIGIEGPNDRAFLVEVWFPPQFNSASFADYTVGDQIQGKVRFSELSVLVPGPELRTCNWSELQVPSQQSSIKLYPLMEAGGFSAMGEWIQ
jgi:hypothetical protein